MSSRSLEEDLLDIPGVEGAEVDGPGVSPSGLRIRIADGADQSAVGAAIRRVLTKHGFGTDTRLPGEDANPRPTGVAGEGARAPSTFEATHDAADSAVDDEHDVASSVMVIAETAEKDNEPGDDVIDLTDALTGEEEPAAPPVEKEPVEEVAVVVEASPSPGSWTSAPPQAEETPQVSDDVEEVSIPAVIARIDRVAVEEARDGIAVTVSSTDGRTESQPASATEGGVEVAVVRAAARLAQPGAPDPTIIEIEDRRIEGVDIVMIVLDIDGTVAAGAAIVGAGRSFALGRATWAALSL